MSFYMIVDGAYAVNAAIPIQYEWHIPKGKPKFEVFPPTRSIVELLQASGHELEVIKQRFENLPMSHSICTWRGPMAQFIYDNL
jgi:hypothetical protein